jgi:hypothetical protein
MISWALDMAPTLNRLQIDRKITIWEVIGRFGGIAPTELDGNNINRLENIMTLSGDPHRAFEDLKSWLIPVEVSLLITKPPPAVTFFLWHRARKILTLFVRLAGWVQPT